jgi:hypothetical protein
MKGIGIALAALLAALPLAQAQRPQFGRRSGGEAPRMAVQRQPAFVERVNHGTIRHDAPVPVRPPVRASYATGTDWHHAPLSPRPPMRRPSYATGTAFPSPIHTLNLTKAGVPFHTVWRNFSFGRRWHRLPGGCVPVIVNGATFYYGDGTFYQPSDDSYQEVYAPVGADISEPPDDLMAIDVNGQTFYYDATDGAFYAQQDDGYVVAPPPIGAVVPELPPEAVQVFINGNPAYQFNGVYYQPVFVNGEQQYQSFTP